MSRRPRLWFFFLFFAATLSCGLWRYSGVMFFLFSAISWPRHATLERIVCKHSCAGAGEPRRRAESWRSAAASSARWIGSRRAQSRSSAVERAIWLADAAYSEAFRRKARDGRRAGTRVCACLITCCGAKSCAFSAGFVRSFDLRARNTRCERKLGGSAVCRARRELLFSASGDICCRRARSKP